MNREVHVRFCERRGVRFPPATHPIYAEWERGEFGSVEWADPEIEWVMTGGPAPGSSTRLAGMAEGWRNFLSAWDWYRVEADEYRELDDGRVLVLIRWQRKRQDQRTGAQSGADGFCDRVPHPRRQGGEALCLLGPRASVRRPRPQGVGGVAGEDHDDRSVVTRDG